MIYLEKLYQLINLKNNLGICVFGNSRVIYIEVKHQLIPNAYSFGTTLNETLATLHGIVKILKVN